MSIPRAATEAVDSARFLARAHSVLREVFGFDSFRVGQTEAIEAAARGRDCLLIMPTGSGKSLCYQVPALILRGLTLVVSPLIALMKDQVDGLALRGIPATFINSSLTFDEQLSRLETLRAGGYRIVYVAPERFRSRAFLRAIASVDIALLAVDEAHCISQWGHDFRPDYRRLRDVRRGLGDVRVIALTATATPDVQRDILRELDMKDPARLVTGFDRPNLRYRVKKVRSDASKLEDLRGFLQENLTEARGERPPAGIVYAGTRRRAEEVASFLSSTGLPGAEGIDGPFCRAYHAGLGDDERREVQEVFMEGRLPCVAATNAFGMGVDKADIRYVVHYDLPGSVEAYYQEVGRAGRDGLRSECLLLFAEKDRHLQEFFIEGANPSRETIETVHSFLWDLGENPIFRSLRDLEMGLARERPLATKADSLALRSSLTVLERAGALERLDHHEQLAEVAPGKRGRWDDNPFGNRATLRRCLWQALKNVFDQSDMQPASLELQHWASELELPLDALRRGLAHLVEDGWIRYTPPFRGRAIRLPEERGPLAVDFEALERKRRREEERLEKIIGFARSRECRRNYVLGYFGEAIPDTDCGTCDRCSARGRPADAVRPLDDDQFTVVRKILSGVARVRGRCGRNRVIQMLRGSGAQGVLELELDKLSTYGILDGMRREIVIEIMEQLEDAGCLYREGDRYPVLQLTGRGLRVMRGEERVELAFPRDLGRRRAAAEAATRTRDDAAVELSEEEENLFQELRSLRRELARELAIPAYRVFNDRTLRAMARSRPSSEAELLRVTGVGATTLKRFGGQFLARIKGADVSL